MQCKNRFTSDKAGFEGVEVVSRVTWIEVREPVPVCQVASAELWLLKLASVYKNLCVLHGRGEFL